MPKRRGGRRNRRRGGRKTRINKPQLGLMPSVQNKNAAHITETVDLGTFLTNTNYQQQFCILQFPRAVQLCRFFKFYRAKRIVYDYMPENNVSQANTQTKDAQGNVISSTASVQIPYMYYMMNRDGSQYSSDSLGQFDNTGCRTIKFTKKIVIAYKPNLAQLINVIQPNVQGPVQAVYNLGATPIYDKWISTNGIGAPIGNNQYINIGLTEPPNSVQAFQSQNMPYVRNAPTYYGHDFYLEQYNGLNSETTVSLPCGWSTVTVEWEFKEPVYYQYPLGPREETANVDPLI